MQDACWMPNFSLIFHTNDDAPRCDWRHFIASPVMQIRLNAIFVYPDFLSYQFCGMKT